MTNSIIYDGAADCYKNSGVLSLNVGNIIGKPGNCSAGASTADPKFAPKIGDPGYYPLYSNSPAIDAGVAAHCLKTDQLGEARGSNYNMGAIETTVALPKKKPTAAAPKTAAATAKPEVNTCLALSYRIVVDCARAYAVGTQFTQVGAAGIGNAAVIAAGYIDAVDDLGAGIEVCFLQSSGAITFLNAATSPRAVTTLPAYSANGMVCTFVERPGTVVLVPGPVPAAAPAAASAEGSSTLTNCMVDLTHNLNFRASPGGEIIGVLPYTALLTAVERTASWFKVDYHGRKGWISTDYVTPQGACG